MEMKNRWLNYKLTRVFESTSTIYVSRFDLT